MNSGIVKMFNVDKGFGFIVNNGGGDDVFFHFSAIRGGQRNPASGQKVTFDMERDSRSGKMRAANVSFA